MNQEAEQRIIAVVRDLFFAVRIRDTLRPHGYQVAVVKTDAALRAALASPPVLIIVDLAFTAIAPPDLIAGLKREPATRAIPVLAFGSHLDHDARAAAKAAGADRVVPNSKLAESLPELVARYALCAGAPPPSQDDEAEDHATIAPADEAAGEG